MFIYVVLFIMLVTLMYLLFKVEKLEKEKDNIYRNQKIFEERFGLLFNYEVDFEVDE